MKKEFCGVVIALRIAFRLMWTHKLLFVVSPLIIGLCLEAMEDVKKLQTQEQ